MIGKTNTREMPEKYTYTVSLLDAVRPLNDSKAMITSSEEVTDVYDITINGNTETVYASSAISAQPKTISSDKSIADLSTRVYDFNNTAWSNSSNMNTARNSLAGCGAQSSALSFGGNSSSYSYCTLSPYADSYRSNYVWRVYSTGYAIHSYARDANVVRPSVYLKSDVSITSGDGTQASPYKISMN